MFTKGFEQFSLSQVSITVGMSILLSTTGVYFSNQAVGEKIVFFPKSSLCVYLYREREDGGNDFKVNNIISWVKYTIGHLKFAAENC